MSKYGVNFHTLVRAIEYKMVDARRVTNFKTQTFIDLNFKSDMFIRLLRCRNRSTLLRLRGAIPFNDRRRWELRGTERILLSEAIELFRTTNRPHSKMYNFRDAVNDGFITVMPAVVKERCPLWTSWKMFKGRPIWVLVDDFFMDYLRYNGSRTYMPIKSLSENEICEKALLITLNSKL